MKNSKIFSFFLTTLLFSCSTNSSSLNNSTSDKSLISNVNNQDGEYINSLRENIVNDYKNEGLDKPLLKIDVNSQLKYIDDTDLINAGKLTCKILDNINPKDDKFDPLTMRGASQETKHPYVYTKIREYLDPKLKFNQQDLDFASLSNSDQIHFLGLLPHFIAKNTLNNSIKYYCPTKI